MPPRGRDSYSIQSVENALAVLEALCEGGEEVRISHLSERLGMNKTSVFRLLATFENRGYVEREKGTGKYRLGLSAYEMGQKFLSRMSLLRQARLVVERLVRKSNEAVYIAVRRYEEILFLDLVDTSQQVRILSLLGNRYPLRENAAGKVLLAYLLTKDPAGGQRKPERHEGNLSAEEAQRTRQQGYCSDQGTLGEGIVSLAVPVFGPEGDPIGCLCMVGPDFRMSPERIQTELLPPLKETGEIISSKLGYLGHFLGNVLR